MSTTENTRATAAGAGYDPELGARLDADSTGEGR